jgi:hypothetical protein
MASGEIYRGREFLRDVGIFALVLGTLAVGAEFLTD